MSTSRVVYVVYEDHSTIRSIHFSRNGAEEQIINYIEEDRYAHPDDFTIHVEKVLP